MTFTLYEHGARLELTQEEFEDFILEELQRILTSSGPLKVMEYHNTFGKFKGLALGGVLTEDQAFALRDLAGSATGQKPLQEKPLAKTEQEQRKQIHEILSNPKRRN